MPKANDDVLARWIASHRFEKREGQPVLPPRNDPLGKLLQEALVRSDGSLHSGLGPLSEVALRKQGFTLVPVVGDRTGLRMGLASGTLRAGGYKLPMADGDLARRIANHTFERRGGQPVLPPKTDRFTQRLYHSLVRPNGALASALGPLAQEALSKEGFTLVQVAGGRWGPRMGLARNTLRGGGTSPAAFLPVAGQQQASREDQNAPAVPTPVHPSQPTITTAARMNPVSAATPAAAAFRPSSTTAAAARMNSAAPPAAATSRPSTTTASRPALQFPGGRSILRTPSPTRR